MSAENDFLVFAGSSGANVITQSAYAALSALTNGFSAGLAASNQLNKVWRQSSIMAAVMAGFIVQETGDNVIDNGSSGLATILANFTSAVQAAAVAGLFSAASATVPGYFEFENGIKVCWGTTNLGGTSGTVTMPISFTSTTSYVPVGIMGDSSGGTANFTRSSANSFAVNVGGSTGSTNVNWVAFGH